MVCIPLQEQGFGKHINQWQKATLQISLFKPYNEALLHQQSVEQIEVMHCWIPALWELFNSGHWGKKDFPCTRHHVVSFTRNKNESGRLASHFRLLGGDLALGGAIIGQHSFVEHLARKDLAGVISFKGESWREGKRKARGLTTALYWTITFILLCSHCLRDRSSIRLCKCPMKQ